MHFSDKDSYLSLDELSNAFNACGANPTVSLPQLISEVTGNDLSCTGSDLDTTVYYKDNSMIYFKADEIKEIFTDANKKGDGKLDMDGKCGQCFIDRLPRPHITISTL